jgi:hypothetical protein
MPSDISLSGRGAPEEDRAAEPRVHRLSAS